MSVYEGSFTLGTGEATAAFYTHLVVKTVCGSFNLTVELLVALNTFLRERARDPLSPLHLERYGDRIRIVSDALGSRGYCESTIHTYTRIIGELMLWLDKHDPGRLNPAKLEAFFAHLVRNPESVPELGKDRGEPVDGRALKYVAFHAVRTVLDRCFDMGLTWTMTPPPRPDHIAPASAETVRALYLAAKTDRERLLLVLVNGLGLMPYQAASLRWDAFDTFLQRVTVTCGGEQPKGTRTVQIVGGYRKLLSECRARALTAAKEGDSPGAGLYVFPSRRKGEVNAVTVRTLQNVLARMTRRRRFDQHVTLTSLRLGGAHMPSRTEWRGAAGAKPAAAPVLTPGSPDPASAMTGTNGVAGTASDGTTRSAAVQAPPVTAAAAADGDIRPAGKPLTEREQRPPGTSPPEDAAGHKAAADPDPAPS